MTQLLDTRIAIIFCLSNPGQTNTLKGDNMNDKDAKITSFNEHRNVLTNILETFIIKVPSSSGWWHRMYAHPKGIQFPSNELLSRLGVVSDLPDYIVVVLLN